MIIYTYIYENPNIWLLILSFFLAGRRSERKRPNKPRRAAPEQDLLKDDPIPFDFLEHGKRYRRQTTDCQPDGTRHILFMLDTSGSIGKTEFDKMTTALSTLVTLFCLPEKKKELITKYLDFRIYTCI